MDLWASKRPRSTTILKDHIPEKRHVCLPASWAQCFAIHVHKTTETFKNSYFTPSFTCQVNPLAYHSYPFVTKGGLLKLVPSEGPEMGTNTDQPLPAAEVAFRRDRSLGAVTHGEDHVMDRRWLKPSVNKSQV